MQLEHTDNSFDYLCSPINQPHYKHPSETQIALNTWEWWRRTSKTLLANSEKTYVRLESIKIRREFLFEYHPPLFLTASINSCTSLAVRWSREILQLSVFWAVKVVITSPPSTSCLTLILGKVSSCQLAIFAVIENLLDNTSILVEHEKKPCSEAKKLSKMLEEFRSYPHSADI